MHAFSKGILQWYESNRRDLPWRKVGITPYEVVIAEIMLQQTNVPKVREKYVEFLRRFPTISDLARASKAEVIHAWQGLGYNRRALQLHAFARVVCDKHGGIVPCNTIDLRNLPGIGSYTAGSIASFAYNLPEPAIDVNLRRIFIRFFQGRDQALPMSREEERNLYELVKSIIPSGRSADFHNALMDFGSVVCVKIPHCAVCPVHQQCCFFPLYKQEGQRVLYVKEKKVEQGMNECGKHVPNRIFRGRIVEYIRGHEGKEIDFVDLGLIIKKDYTNNDEGGLRSLCIKLEKEGFIRSLISDRKIIFYLGNEN